MRSMALVVLLAGSADANPTPYTPPMMQAASTPTARAGKAQVKGVVVAKGGKPVPYFGLVLQEHDTLTYASMPIAVRDAKGEFHFSGVQAGTWKLILVGPGFTRSVTNVVLADGKTTDAGSITVDLGSELTGMVTDEAGKPVSGAKVCASHRQGGLSMTISSIGGQPPTESELADARDGRQCTLANKNGHYVIRGIEDAPKSVIPSKRLPTVTIEASGAGLSAKDTVGYAKQMVRDLKLK